MILYTRNRCQVMLNRSTMVTSTRCEKAVEVLTCENDSLRLEIAPALGGRILSIYNKQLDREFVYRHDRPLEAFSPGTEYDANFAGGIDELIPNDIPEEIDGISYPDHGELWTTPLKYAMVDNSLILSGKLKLSSLSYERVMSFDRTAPVVYLKYKIRNEAEHARHFLWKLHAALAIESGDKLVTSAKKARSVSPDASRFTDMSAFRWPCIENCDASIVPHLGNTMDFFYLYDIPGCSMQMLSEQGNHLFSYDYDRSVFPYQWYFASYGAFLNHFTAILEPATGMPVSVNESMALGQCMKLDPQEEINTTVSIYAGRHHQD